MDEIVREFLDETTEHLDALSEILETLSADPDDGAARDHMMLILHTIKGNSRFVEAQDIETAAHRAEEIVRADAAEKILRTAILDIKECVYAFENAAKDVREAKTLRQRLDKMVMDIAAMLGKKVVLDFNLPANEEADIAHIRDALLHLLRNAVDHGIEQPDMRRQAGKDETGRITVTFSRENGHRVIHIEDDGRGLSEEKIRKTAQDRGVKTAAELQDMSREEILALSLLPGFSTRSGSSLVSGRGVGMWAVHEKVTALGGVLTVHSQENTGSTYTITLPEK